MRYNKVFERMSVGANGGSFAVGYWDNVLIPNVDDAFMDILADLYNKKSESNPAIFDAECIEEAGIYQLNAFLIKCKALLKCLCDDIKNGSLKPENYYLHYAD